MKFLVYLFFIALILFSSSCRREGCTDKYALNYCDKCKRNDGSCIYESKCIFWHNKATNDSLIFYNRTSLRYLINGELVKTYVISSNVLYSPPSCDAEGMCSQTRTLKNDGSHMEYYEIRDNLNNKLWEGMIDFNANSPCIIIQQEWKP